MAEFYEIAIFQPIQVRFVSNLKLKFRFQPILKSKSKMTQSKMFESKIQVGRIQDGQIQDDPIQDDPI